jgi:TonB family protein
MGLTVLDLFKFGVPKMLGLRRYRSFILLALISSTTSMVGSTLKLESGTTSWVGGGSNEVPFVLELQDNGTLLYIDARGAAYRGLWNRQGQTVEMDVQSGDIKLSGIIEDGRMHGTGTDNNHRRWEWFAIKQPAVVERVVPKYPALGAAARIAGTVVIDVNVSPAGTVTTVNALSGHPLLRRVSEEAALGWKFRPAARDPLRVSRLLFIFRILDKEKDETVVSPVLLSPYRVEIRRGIPSVQYDSRRGWSL